MERPAVRSIYSKDRVVLVLNGKYAGRKAIILKSCDEGTKERPYSHLIIGGVDRYPKKITKDMGKTKVEKKSRFSVFVKVINSNHVLPTRYCTKLDIDMRKIDGKSLKIIKNRRKLKALLKENMVKKFNSVQSKYIFRKLRF